MATILPLSKAITTSRYSLLAACYDAVNWTPMANYINHTTSADTPKGVLGGMVATTSLGVNWQAAIGVSCMVNAGAGGPLTGRTQVITAALPAIGLFAGSSEGNAFENAPAAASGVVPIYLAPGIFEVYVFETNYHSVYATDTLVTGTPYTIGCPLYASPFGFLTPEIPTLQDDMANYNDSTAIAVILGYCVKVPTHADLSLGVQLCSPWIV